MLRPSSMAATMVAKLSSMQHQVGDFARDVAAALAHGDADVGALERRGVVHAVAGHGDDLASVFQRLDQPQLVLRRHAGEDVDRRDRLAAVARATSRSSSAPVSTRLGADADDLRPTALAVAG